MNDKPEKPPKGYYEVSEPITFESNRGNTTKISFYAPYEHEGDALEIIVRTLDYCGCFDGIFDGIDEIGESEEGKDKN